ncbi:MAG: multisubunit Na+/H+ antiporter MnhB subunit [Motiliproteus sp.]|jgi:multisubunit Na+/H+ antiporter MnhB subunit
MDSWQFVVIDALLALTAVVLAGMSVLGSDQKRSIVLFIAFGLLLSLIWARLKAPDLALAEAAIGAGLTGALLFSALQSSTTEEGGSKQKKVRIGIPCKRAVGWLAAALIAGVATAMIWALEDGRIQPAAFNLSDQVFGHLQQSGVSNPVTAVLLNFRAYDTLLELAVLLSVALGIMALGRPPLPVAAPGPVLVFLVGILVPLLVLTAGYLLWVGAHAPGGAFQGGAVLAAAGVLLALSGHRDAWLPGPRALPALLGAGLFLFIGAGVAMTLSGAVFLQYPEGWAGAIILIIETMALLSIALTLVLAYLGGLPVQDACAQARRADVDAS